MITIDVENWLETVPDIASEYEIGQPELEVDVEQEDQDWGDASDWEFHRKGGRFLSGDSDSERVNEKRRKLADVTNHRVGSRELASLLPVIVPPRPKFVPRPSAVQHAIVMDVTTCGIDAEDRMYLKEGDFSLFLTGGAVIAMPQDIIIILFFSFSQKFFSKMHNNFRKDV